MTVQLICQHGNARSGVCAVCERDHECDRVCISWRDRTTGHTLVEVGKVVQRSRRVERARSTVDAVCVERVARPGDSGSRVHVDLSGEIRVGCTTPLVAMENPASEMVSAVVVLVVGKVSVPPDGNDVVVPEPGGWA